MLTKSSKKQLLITVDTAQKTSFFVQWEDTTTIAAYD